MTSKSPLLEASELSGEILQDMELARIPNHQILLKCRRLARLVGDEQGGKWLDFELHGYYQLPKDVSREEFLAHFDRFGRLQDKEKQTGFIEPLATLEQQIDTEKLVIQSCQVPSSIQASSAQTYLPDSASATVQWVLGRLRDLNQAISKKQAIIGRVMGFAHSYTLRWYNELHYSDIAQSIFERRRAEVDGKLKDVCPIALEQFVSAYERLRSGSAEDWSQALLSCRRILKSFADAVFTPKSAPYIDKNGVEHEVSEDKYINRLIAFIEQRISSDTLGALVRSQVESLGMRLAAIHDETHKAVHAEVTRQEADSTVLLTYLLLSDMVDLIEDADKPGPEITGGQASPASPTPNTI
jgi:hypothetical protein